MGAGRSSGECGFRDVRRGWGGVGCRETYSELKSCPQVEYDLGHQARLLVVVRFDSEDTAETAVPQQTLPVPDSSGLRRWGGGVDMIRGVPSPSSAVDSLWRELGVSKVFSRVARGRLERIGVKRNGIDV